MNRLTIFTGLLLFLIIGCQENVTQSKEALLPQEEIQLEKVLTLQKQLEEKERLERENSSNPDSILQIQKARVEKELRYVQKELEKTKLRLQQASTENQ